MSVTVRIPRGVVVDFCRRSHIRCMALFGSSLRDDLTSGSDVNVLVEVERRRTVGFGFVDIQYESPKVFGHPVDMETFESAEPSRNWVLRSENIESAETIFGGGA